MTALPEPRAAATHNLALAHQLGAELGAVQRQVDVEVDAVEGALLRVHALKVLLQVLSRQVRSQGDHLLDPCSERRVRQRSGGERERESVCV